MARYAHDDPYNNTYAMDIMASKSRAAATKGTLKCLLKSRHKGHWISSRGRFMTLVELFRAQGIDFNHIKRANTVSDRQLGMMCGNAMSQNVLEALFASIATATNNFAFANEPPHHTAATQPPDNYHHHQMQYDPHRNCQPE